MNQGHVSAFSECYPNEGYRDIANIKSTNLSYQPNPIVFVYCFLWWQIRL